MAKRRQKRRTHVGFNNPRTQNSGASIKKDPKSMVIRIGAGEVGPSVSQLVSDVRRVMEPGTASRLKERRANKLRDYVAMCGSLGISHLLLFSRSSSGNTNMRLAVAPRGPTLNFKVEKYTLAKDVQKAQKRPRGGGTEYITAPLLVMNNFVTDSKSTPKHVESLVTTVFQSLFPPINPQATTLQSIRRILLLNREQTQEGFFLNLRHYAITTKTTGVSRPLKRLNAASKLQRQGKGLPNLGKLQDISEFLTSNGGDGYMTDATSASELESDAEVEVVEAQARKLNNKRRRAGKDQEGEGEEEEEEEEHVEKRAIRLIELGPRLKLRLSKVEEGLCGGKVMWHEYINKTPEEMKELERRWEQRRREKDARKKQQKENIEKKKAAKVAAGGKDGDEMDLDDELQPEDLEDYADWGFDSEGLGGDAETQVNEEMDEDEAEWDDEEGEEEGEE
ncbi:Ribosome biogenesis protein SSF1 [Zalerion maritima]|uniref:Ribosome biogenesis protein SSF1 n=1 Tax=Zalerion maritima TaxID=339359 RepID=A0AAD5RMM2_9PEZI|nr:Ribosome biogenesis protein SSF1 [Zalerion maritima]